MKTTTATLWCDHSDHDATVEAVDCVGAFGHTGARDVELYEEKIRMVPTRTTWTRYFTKWRTDASS